MYKKMLFLFSLMLLVSIVFIGCTDTISVFEDQNGDSDAVDGDDDSLTGGDDEALSDGDDVQADGDKPDGDDGSTDGDENPADGDENPADGDDDSIPTPSGYAIVDTDQVTCFNAASPMVCPAVGAAYFGQDAQYDGSFSRYQDNGDGTVTDLVTGLMWQQDPGAKQGYYDAIAAAESFNLAGYTDWRAPTVKELYSLILFSGRDVDPMASDGATPFIDDDTFAFSYGDTSSGERIIDSQWVTSNVYTDTVMGGQECFFGVNFADGRIKCYPTAVGPQSDYFAVYVRGGEGYGENDFTDNGDGTITDAATGLMWQKNDSGDTYNWEEALAYCDSLELAGYSDWKLPNSKQLQSLVDYSRSPGFTNSPAIDPIFGLTGITNEAGQADYGFYWSGTTHATQMGGQNAAYVAFGRCMGYMNNTWMDVHGAGAQRSDPKVGDPSDYPNGNGPQGDSIHIYNFARCVRDHSSFNNNPAGNANVDGDIPVDGDETPVDGDEPPVDGDGLGDEPISCDEVQQGMPCCGDDICDGPETAQNCAVDCASVDGDTSPVDGDDDPIGPVSCTSDNDCLVEGACPDDAALGCSCATTPEGDFCIPSCNSDNDCPAIEGLTLICGMEGNCIPQGGPGK